jgi:hypothetical protein
MSPPVDAQILLAMRLLMIISLYAFLGLAIFIMWRELKRQIIVLATRQTPMLSLLHKTPQGSKTLRFSVPEILIGREPACDYTLEDSTVSAQHARLSFHHNQWWIEDMGSRNGTYLNQQFVATPLVVTPGDELRLGQVQFTVVGGEEV